MHAVRPTMILSYLATELAAHPFVDAGRVEESHLRGDRQRLNDLLTDPAPTGVLQGISN